MTDNDYCLVFQCLLSRLPSNAEINDWKDAMSGNESVDVLASSLKESDEYLEKCALMLSARAAFSDKSPRLFFLHVPKSGGTSIDMSIRKIIGLPPLDISDLRCISPFYDGLPIRQHVMSSFWPYIKGHCTINDAPLGYSVFSLMREPLSRFISLFRFLCSNQQRDWFRSHQKIGEDDLPPSRFNLSISEFAMLYDRNIYAHTGTFAWMFASRIDNPKSFSLLSPANRALSLANGIGRLRAAAYIHDHAALQDIFGLAGSKECVKVEVSNASPEEAKDASLAINATISLRTLEYILDILKWDYIFLKLLADSGKAPFLSPDCSIELIAHDAKRLRLDLPSDWEIIFREKIALV